MTQQGEADHYVEIRTIDDLLKAAGKPDKSLASTRCIYTVPRRVRLNNEAIYTPSDVSIGPWHNSRFASKSNRDYYCPEEFRPFKLEYFNAFMQDRCWASMDDLLKYVKSREEYILRCYGLRACNDRESFANMVLIDAGFLIELFYRARRSECYEDSDPIMLDRRLTYDVCIDFTLAENQIPFDILNEIFRRSGGHVHNFTFLDLACQYFKALNRQNVVPGSGNLIQNPCHFADLVRTFMLPPPSIRSEKRIEFESPSAPSITRLWEAGVNFRITASDYIYDIDFEQHRWKRSVLRLPRLSIYDTTEIFWKNTLAFEEHHYGREPLVAELLYMLSMLIQQESDVEILVKNNIIVNGIGSCQKVATLFNSIGNHISGLHSIRKKYSCLCQQLNQFCSRWYNTCRAILIHNYFSNAADTASTLSVVAVLLLSGRETYCSCHK